MEKVEDLTFNPYLGKPLRGRLEGLRSLRAGEYRVIYRVVQEEGEVHIITIGHRKRVYK